ncbi:MAG: radical SAM protein [Oscillospiraceae bacterium]|jgi:radical SAM protein with 4Fe4S-binding SPASM domain|nr:radical SAM protein [Oscillospiraceae bacterium]
MNTLPITCVWEITSKQENNHNLSYSKKKISEELTTQEALNFINMCADLGVFWINFSGEKLLCRNDIFTLIEHCEKNNIFSNIITNANEIDKEKAELLKKYNVSTIAISINKLNDEQKKEKSDFFLIKNAFEILKKFNINTVAITMVTNNNIGYLEKIKKLLISLSVSSWQLQIGLLKEEDSSDQLISPEQVETIMDFCYETTSEKKIHVYPADCIGYYSSKEDKIRKKAFEEDDFSFEGCAAGIKSFGLLSNGDVVGCISLRDKSFVEGNIREKTLREIWESPKAFLWRRSLLSENFEGVCKNSRNSEKKCINKCINTHLAVDVYCGNQYCAHSLSANLHDQKT